jgi:beta-glucosidase
MNANPLWGRNMETPGECPYLSSEFARIHIQGLQGNHSSGILKTVATPKHFVGQIFEGDREFPCASTIVLLHHYFACVLKVD